MGKRKTTTRKPAKKAKVSQPKTFDCIFCRGDGTVTITLDKKEMLGNLKCRVCGKNFQSNLTALDEAVDVYAYWNDDVEERKEAGALD